MFQTEFEFTLPCGYLDSEGTLHRDGVMRRATAADEILPLKDPRVQKNSAYLVVILLSRVVTHLGGVSHINPKVIEDLYATDLAYLQDMYNQINQPGNGHQPVTCPQCEHIFELDHRGRVSVFAAGSVMLQGAQVGGISVRTRSANDRHRVREERQLQRAAYSLRDILLHIEYVGQLAIIGRRPECTSRACAIELHRNTQLVAVFPYASPDEVADTQLLGDIPDIFFRSLEGK